MPDPTFNLVDEPWIPCLLRDDPAVHLLGIRDTLNRAPDIVEIVDSSPLVTVALHRLLLAVVHRCYGPARVDDWRALWAACCWDDRINAYLEQWRHRFDLFDPAHPFYQVSDIPQDYAKPITNIAHELASGNNATLWDHSYSGDTPAFTPDQAARYLVALQAFALGGLVSFRKGETEHKSANAAPLANSAVTLLRGKTLFETLMLNLHRYDGEENPFPASGADRPAWERDTPTRPANRDLTGYLDLLTWQSRQVRLYPEGSPTVVRHVAILKGYQFPQVGYRHGKETMLAFRANPEAKENQDPWPALAFREGRVVWRDSTALFQSSPKERERPKMLDWVAELVGNRILEEEQPLSLDLYGLASDQAKPLFWRHERLPLPLQYLNSSLLLEPIHIALEYAEAGKNTLNRGMQELAERSLVPYPPKKGIDKYGQPIYEISKDDHQRAKEIVREWDAERRYWARLDLPFRQLLVALPDDYDQENDSYGSQEMSRWFSTVRQAARDSFHEVTCSLDGSGRWLRAVAIAGRSFGGAVKRISQA